MREPRCAVEFSQSGFDGNADAVFAVPFSEFAVVGGEGLETAVVGTAVEFVDGWVDGEEVSGELFGLLDTVGG